MADPLQFDLTLYPNPILRKVAEPVEDFGQELARIVAGMVARMAESKGVGLAAPQVGLKRRILVVNETGEPGDGFTLVNPTLLETSGPKVKFEEGCLSFPGIYVDVDRPDRCKVRAFDVDGNPFEAEYGGFESRIVQHEYDHLEGILLVDRMSPADKLRNKVALEELVESYKASKEAAASRPR